MHYACLRSKKRSPIGLVYCTLYIFYECRGGAVSNSEDDGEVRSAVLTVPLRGLTADLPFHAYACTRAAASEASVPTSLVVASSVLASVGMSSTASTRLRRKSREAACVRQDAKPTRGQFPILFDARCDVGNSPRCDAGRVYTQLS